MIRKLCVLLILPIVFGCKKNDDLVALCEIVTKAQLKSPSTYKQIEAVSYSSTFTVLLDYDAANAFGTPIRSNSICEFEHIEGTKNIELKRFVLDGDDDPARRAIGRIALIGKPK